MIRIAICDDEKKILDEVSEYIRNYAEKKCEELEVLSFDSARSLICAKGFQTETYSIQLLGIMLL